MVVDDKVGREARYAVWEAWQEWPGGPQPGL